MYLTILSCVIVTLAAIHSDNEALPVGETVPTFAATIEQVTSNGDQSSTTNEQLETIANKNNCLLRTERLEDCQDELADSQLPIKVITCLNNCATCVRQWRSGVYNGRTCALDCIQQVDNLESLDPDCSLMKYFNSTILASVIA